MIAVISAIYLGSSALTACASLRNDDHKNAALWLVVSIGLLSLGLLRTANAGVWTDDYLRNALREMSLYPDRRGIQVLCIAAFAIAMAVIFGRLGTWSKGVSLIVALCGFAVLSVFAAVRFSSLHWTDAILGRQVGFTTLSHLAQVISLTAISGASLFDLLFARRLETQRTDVS